MTLFSLFYMKKGKKKKKREKKEIKVRGFENGVTIIKCQKC